MLANSNIVPPRKTPSATPTATTINMPAPVQYTQSCKSALQYEGKLKYKIIGLHIAITAL